MTRIVTSSISKRLVESGTLIMLEKVKQLEAAGGDIIRLDVGEPDLNTPDVIKNAIIEAINQDFTRYTSSLGIPELREAIAEDLAHLCEVDPTTEILVTPGSKFPLFSAILVTVNPGDEVLTPYPIWPSHADIICLAGGKPVPAINVLKEGIDEEAVKEAITKRTKALLVNSPGNPVGNVFDIGDARVLKDLAQDHDLIILSDEVYRTLTYPGVNHISMLTFEDLREQLVFIDGFSKRFAMTGHRLGYCVVRNPTIMEAIIKLQQNSTTMAASFVQKGGVAALRFGHQFVAQALKKYTTRRNYLIPHLQELGMPAPQPKGAFYAFAKLPQGYKSSEEFTMNLLEAEQVSTVAGSVFGRGGENHIRISYANSLKKITEALERIERFLGN
ncbi:MAG: pyridoxal phosphate-dependent aminotransferase [Candidatus Heimdallarchaeota archaeon]